MVFSSSDVHSLFDKCCFQLKIEMLEKLHTPQTIDIQVAKVKTERESHEASTKLRGRVSIQCLIIHFPLSRFYLVDDLPCVVPTFYDHFPKPRRRVRPSGFRRAGWRRCQSAVIGRCGRRRGELPSRKTTGLSAFACDCAVGYHAVMMTVMWRRRSGYRMSFWPCGYSSVREWRFFFQRHLPFWLGKPTFWLPEIRGKTNLGRLTKFTNRLSM